jgi:hypothetical protein
MKRLNEFPLGMKRLLFNVDRTAAKMNDEYEVCVLRALLPIILIPLLLRSSACIRRTGTEYSSEIHYMQQPLSNLCQ